MTAVAAVAVGAAGLAVGAAVNRLAGRYPWDGTATRRAAVRPPVLELVAAACAVLVLLRFELSAPALAWWWFAAAGLLLAAIDLRWLLLPNRVLLPAFLVAAGLLGVAALTSGDATALLRPLLAAAVCFAVGLVMALISPASLGMGDVKLAALLGLMLGWLGWPHVLLGFLAGFVLQALAALAVLAARRAGRDSHLPFGPALVAGTLLAALVTGG